MLTFYHLIIFFFSNLIIINLISLQTIYNKLNFNKKMKYYIVSERYFVWRNIKSVMTFHFKNNCF